MNDFRYFNLDHLHNGVKAEIKQIHFNLLGHGLARIHTDSLNYIRLRRMGTCAIADPSKL